MKSKILTLLIISAFILTGLNSYSQCTPASPEECPDPENNGQVCPDTLAVAYVDQFYSQVATIKPPAVYYLPPDSTEIPLHHVKLMEVGNLPEGITWQSNTPDSVFVAGEYYCVLMEGTPVTAGVYPLRIVVDVYVLIGNFPVKVATAVDSTSLSMVVLDNSGIYEHKNPSFYVKRNIPNPFQSETWIEYYAEKAGPVEFEIYNMMGKLLYSDKLKAIKGDNMLYYNGQSLPAGTYFYRLESENYQASGIMVRMN